jgi:hypothetical protein
VFSTVRGEITTANKTLPCLQQQKLNAGEEFDPVRTGCDHPGI